MKDYTDYLIDNNQLVSKAKSMEKRSSMVKMVHLKTGWQPGRNIAMKEMRSILKEVS